MSIQPAQLAIPTLYDRVAARFLAEGTNVPMAFGWNAASTQLRSDARIVWIPGDQSGNLGRIGAPKYPGQDQLRTLFELVTVEIVTADTTALDDERAQYRSARLLHDAFIRAVHLSAVGTYQITSDGWMSGDRNRRYGAGIRLVLEVQAPITDDALERESLLLDAALLAAYELDHEETISVTRGEPV